MPFPVFNRALLQGVMSGALVLASATACSRSDRSETGQTNSAFQDTLAAGDKIPAGYRATERDTTGGVSPTGLVRGDTTGNAGPIRPPEDSSELYGDGMSGETADEQAIDAESQE